MNTRDYWKECIAIAAEECPTPIVLTSEQLDYIAESVEGGYENYGQAFYSPPASDRLNAIEAEWKQKYAALKADFDNYKRGSEKAIRNALHLHHDANIGINAEGEVHSYGGRIVQIL